MEAESLQPDMYWPWMAAISALLIGGLKAKLLFSRNCRNNLARIAALKQPKIWEFFRPVFFLFLFCMILAGAFLSRRAHGNYGFLLCIATLDLAISIALLGSSYVFWKEGFTSA